MDKFTKEQAIDFCNSKQWEQLTAREITVLQLHQDYLCVPFDVYHKSIEETLARPVFTHEFGLRREKLKEELACLIGKPSFEEIISIISIDKLLIIGV